MDNTAAITKIVNNITSDAASLEAWSTSFDPVIKALVSFSEATNDAAGVIAKYVAENRGFIDAYKPYDIADVRLVLPHKKHLVPMHQEAKNRKQLAMWGLRKR